MSQKYTYVFSKEDIKKGKFQDFLDYTNQVNIAAAEGKLNYYTNYCVSACEGAMIVEFTYVDISNGQKGGKFRFVKPNQKIVTKACLPNGKTVYVEDFKEYVKSL